MVARNDEFFDFDVFQDLDLLQPVDESCVSTRLTTTTNAPPPDYCNTIRISGSENHYGAVEHITNLERSMVKTSGAWLPDGKSHTAVEDNLFYITVI